MTRVEAFIALFGGLPQDATQEHVDLVKDNLDPTDEEWEEISDGMDTYIQRSLRTFKNDPEFFISSVENERTRELLSSMVPKPVEQKKASEPTEETTKVTAAPQVSAKKKPKGTPVSSSNFSALFAPAKPVKNVPVEKSRTDSAEEHPPEILRPSPQDDIIIPILPLTTKTPNPPVLIFPVDTETKPSDTDHPHTNPSTKRGVTTELTVLTVYKVFIPAFVLELLKQEDWHTARKRIEDVVQKTQTNDSIEMLDAFKAFSGWKVYMTEYAQGCSGYEKCIFGAYMLECMNALESGMRPESDEYQCRYVTGEMSTH